MIVGIAAMMFVALFGWGQEYFHWSDPSGKVQLACSPRSSWESSAAIRPRVTRALGRARAAR